MEKAQFWIGDRKVWFTWDGIVDLYHVLESVLEEGGYFEEEGDDEPKSELNVLDEVLSPEHDIGWSYEDRKREEYDMLRAIRETEEEEEMIGKVENVCGGMSKDFDRVLKGEKV